MSPFMCILNWKYSYIFIGLGLQIDFFGRNTASNIIDIRILELGFFTIKINLPQYTQVSISFQQVFGEQQEDWWEIHP